jgi:hypothetical protein
MPDLLNSDSNTGFKYRLLDLRHKSIHTPTTMISATPSQLRKAADIQERIESLQKELYEILGGEVSTPAEPSEAPKKRKFSAAAKARMRAAQRARWAKIKGTAPSAKPTRKVKRKMSAAGLANIRAAQKARWAKAKKSG